MSDLYWLTEEQMDRLRPFFPKSHGKPRVDDRCVLSGIIFVNRNGLRWRYRSLALDGIKRECDIKLAEERTARVKARQMEDLRLYRESEAIRKLRLEQESQVVQPKKTVDPAPTVPESPDPGNEFEDDWDDSPSFGM